MAERGGFQAMHESGQRRQAAHRGKSIDRGHLGGAGKTGEGGETTWRNARRGRQHNAKVTDDLQAQERLDQCRSARRDRPCT